MQHESVMLFLADAVLILHIAIVMFVVGGLLLIIVGNRKKWAWVNNLWFRLAHLAAIAIVASEAWLDIVCPLTTLEMWLRSHAGAAVYTGGFIEHWLQWVLYYNAPPWVFVLLYSSFGLLVAAAWYYFPPVWKRHTHGA